MIIVTGRLLLAQEIALAPARETKPAAEEKDAGSSSYVIFSNLGSPGDLFNSTSFDARPLAGSNVQGEPEEWQAVRFVPKYDVQVTTLEAAIGYSFGTQIVTLALYNDDPTFHYPGTVLPGSQVDTTDIPHLGVCCTLTTVTLPGKGVSLTAGTVYWLVGKPNDAKGPDFEGGWQVSYSGDSAYHEPPNPWDPQAGQWPAARISGHRLKSSASLVASAAVEMGDSSNKVTFFTNIDPASSYPYFAGIGLLIAGKDSEVGDVTEALPFTARASGYAKTLSAAICLYRGPDQGIILSLYTDHYGLPGEQLPRASGSTSDFPDAGDCCQFANVRLPGKGVALTEGLKYWLVAAPDDVNAPDFEGFWQQTTIAEGSDLKPGEENWNDYTSYWMAAKITGTNQ
ncbi:MAG TPA: hypothetical protein VGG02_03160 [Chthoniobacterales bacterium]|jgi:hypothetical protein